MMNCFKLLLIIFNIAFIIVGLALLSIGIWTAVAKIYVSFVIGDSLFSAASYMLIGVGIVTVAVCIVGIIALIKEKKRWLIIYFGLLIFCFLVLITSAILAIVFKGEVEDVMVTSMRESLINGYSQDRDITDAWDQLQEDLKCCAISEKYVLQTYLYDEEYLDGTFPVNEEERVRQDSWPVYKRTEFYRRQLGIITNERKYVPPSCCKYDEKLGDYTNLGVCQYFSSGPPNNYAMGLSNDYLHYVGCYERAKELVLDQSDIIVALGFVFGFIMISGMVLTFLVIRSLAEEEETKRRSR